MSELRFKVAGQNKAEIDWEIKATVQRFIGKPAEPTSITMSVLPAYRIDSSEPDFWEATVHYEW